MAIVCGVCSVTYGYEVMSFSMTIERATNKMTESL